jgi:hypothetical protein
MCDLPKHIGRGDTAIEFRDPRFAELDAQINAEAAEGQKTVGSTPNRRRAGPRLPAAVRKEITRCAQQLRQHRQLFIDDARLKDRAARFLRSVLPPRRKRGRPGIDKSGLAPTAPAFYLDALH